MIERTLVWFYCYFIKFSIFRYFYFPLVIFCSFSLCKHFLSFVYLFVIDWNLSCPSVSHFSCPLGSVWVSDVCVRVVSIVPLGVHIQTTRYRCEVRVMSLSSCLVIDGRRVGICPFELVDISYLTISYHKSLGGFEMYGLVVLRFSCSGSLLSIVSRTIPG